MITILLTIALVGVVVYLITLIPMPAPFQQIIISVAVILVILWLISGLHGAAPLDLQFKR